MLQDNSQAVTAFLGQFYNSSDLETFWELAAPLSTDTPIKLVGDATTGPGGAEAMLDIELITAMGAQIPTEFWGFSGSSPQYYADEPFLTWLTVVSNTTDAEVPKVFSTSYGDDEAAEVPSDYADRINVELMKAGLRGISLLFASGDKGSASLAGTCPNDRFMPTWPASSPYVTAVGGTSGGYLAPERAWRELSSAGESSGGGYSEVFAAPAWQAGVTLAYAELGDSDIPPASYFNKHGRGFPDISAQAVFVPIILDGKTVLKRGTSASCPIFSGIFSLLNDARLAAGKSSLGFLNPLLYANPEALNDVTLGVQGGCGSVSGFPAKEGWDAVTGLGTPDYEKLLDVVMKLQ